MTTISVLTISIVFGKAHRITNFHASDKKNHKCSVQTLIFRSKRIQFIYLSYWKPSLIWVLRRQNSAQRQENWNSAGFLSNNVFVAQMFPKKLSEWRNRTIFQFFLQSIWHFYHISPDQLSKHTRQHVAFPKPNSPANKCLTIYKRVQFTNITLHHYNSRWHNWCFLIALIYVKNRLDHLLSPSAGLWSIPILDLIHCTSFWTDTFFSRVPHSGFKQLKQTINFCANSIFSSYDFSKNLEQGVGIWWILVLHNRQLNL